MPPDLDIVMFYPMEYAWTPSVIARLNLERGARYVVDFNVSTRGGFRFGAYIQGAEDNMYFPATRSGPFRISMVVESSGSGYTEVLVWANQFWDFHSVDMTRID